MVSPLGRAEVFTLSACEHAPMPKPLLQIFKRPVCAQIRSWWAAQLWVKVTLWFRMTLYCFHTQWLWSLLLISVTPCPIKWTATNSLALVLGRIEIMPWVICSLRNCCQNTSVTIWSRLSCSSQGTQIISMNWFSPYICKNITNVYLNYQASISRV